MGINFSNMGGNPVTTAPAPVETTESIISTTTTTNQLVDVAENSIQQVVLPTGQITLDLGKNSVLNLNKVAPQLQEIIFGAGWDPAVGGTTFDLDISGWLLNANHKLISGSHVIYFNNLSAHGCTLMGDNLTGVGEGDDETMEINLDQVPSDVEYISFVVNIYNARSKRQTFAQISNAYARLLNKATGDEICRFRLRDDYGISTGVILAELKRKGNTWEFISIGEGKVLDSLQNVVELYS